MNTYPILFTTTEQLMLFHKSSTLGRTKVRRYHHVRRPFVEFSKPIGCCAVWDNDKERIHAKLFEQQVEERYNLDCLAYQTPILITLQHESLTLIYLPRPISSARIHGELLSHW